MEDLCLYDHSEDMYTRTRDEHFFDQDHVKNNLIQDRMVRHDNPIGPLLLTFKLVGLNPRLYVLEPETDERSNVKLFGHSLIPALATQQSLTRLKLGFSFRYNSFSEIDSLALAILKNLPETLQTLDFCYNFSHEVCGRLS
ncbi:hypothetical protein BGX26_006077 [Mortierella sp. AD094]|nr:hypothetical protein BGX26_006077 [Mortierella sp. AD094]